MTLSANSSPSWNILLLQLLPFCFHIHLLPSHYFALTHASFFLFLPLSSHPLRGHRQLRACSHICWFSRCRHQLAQWWTGGAVASTVAFIPRRWAGFKSHSAWPRSQSSWRLQGNNVLAHRRERIYRNEPSNLKQAFSTGLFCGNAGQIAPHYLFPFLGKTYLNYVFLYVKG